MTSAGESKMPRTVGLGGNGGGRILSKTKLSNCQSKIIKYRKLKWSGQVHRAKVKTTRATKG